MKTENISTVCKYSIDEFLAHIDERLAALSGEARTERFNPIRLIAMRDHVLNRRRRASAEAVHQSVRPRVCVVSLLERLERIMRDRSPDVVRLAEHAVFRCGGQSLIESGAGKCHKVSGTHFIPAIRSSASRTPSQAFIIDSYCIVTNYRVQVTSVIVNL